MKITVADVDLSAEIGVDREYDSDGDCVAQRRTTLADMVAERIADDLKRTEEYPGLRKQVLVVREDLIRELLTPTIEEVAAAPIRKTNNYGEHTGPETTLRELILERAAAELMGRSTAYRANSGESVIAHLVREAVTKTVDEKLAAMRDDLHEQVKARVDAHLVALAKKALAAA